MLIEQHQLAQCVDLSLTIKRGSVHLPERVSFNPIKVSNNSGDVLVETWRHLATEALRRGGGGVRSHGVLPGGE